MSMNEKSRARGSLTVIGLGPGRAGLVTKESWSLMEKAERLVLRTEIHPTVETLREAGIAFTSYDKFYESAGSFRTLYRTIAGDLIRRAEQGEKIVYAVPGSPFVAEQTVSLLREEAKEHSIPLKILPGMSFMEALYASLNIDPIEGLAILDAETIVEKSVSCSVAKVVTQIYSQQVASETKLFLMEEYPDEYGITYLHHLSLEDEEIRQIPLYELDRQPDIDHLTCLFIPPVR